MVEVLVMISLGSFVGTEMFETATLGLAFGDLLV